MKYSTIKIAFALALSITVISCSKDGANDSAALSNTGTGKGGSLARFTIVGNYLYTVTNNYLSTYNISDPANVALANSTRINFTVETIYPFGNKLFIGTTTGLLIYSLENPATPVKVGEAQHARSCDPVVANDSIAFVTLKGNTFCGPAVSGLYVHDIRNIFAPQLIKTVELDSPEGLGLQGSTLYICCNAFGLKVFNVANPSNPIEIRTITGPYFKDVIPYGDLLICYVSTGLMLYDISNPTNPIEVKFIANL